jgi:hypothetical protein
MDRAVFDSVEREIEDEVHKRFPGDAVQRVVLLHYGRLLPAPLPSPKPATHTARHAWTTSPGRQGPGGELQGVRYHPGTTGARLLPKLPP